MPTQSAAKRKTCKRYNDPGHAHFLTFSCYKRQRFLTSERTRAWMLDAIGATCRKYNLALWAYVIMPEHVHLLILPRESEYGISRILSSLKQPVAKRAILYARQHHPDVVDKMTDQQPNGQRSLRFWQRGGGYDRNLWSPRHIWETSDYIHGNPVRRNLCDCDVDWPWSSARAYAGMNDGQLSIDSELLPDDPRRINAPS